MERTDYVEFTEDGLGKVCEALSYLPEDQRKFLVLETIKSVIRA